MKTISIKQTIVLATSTLVAGLILGWAIFAHTPASNSDQSESHEHNQGTTWTCSMHPQVRASEPGKCPICGMDLVPLDAGTNAGEGSMVVLSENAMRLANVQTMVVGKRGDVAKELILNGKVAPDERKLHSQTSHVPGRVERLAVNFTGEFVKRGQTLATLYSPELLTAQQELLEAYRIKDSQPALYEAAREKLKNWKMSEAGIDELISKGRTSETYTISADASGVVVEKKVNEGDYVDRGQSLYEIADLSRIWILLDLYESDIPWVRIGSNVNIETRSRPGQPFEGKITYIDPLVDPQTRVASARVEMSNPGMALKPGMFVTGRLTSDPGHAKDALMVPKTAVMWTGQRSVVYVKQTTDRGTGFEMRVVTLGPATNDAYPILDGLRDGEEIVINGTFAVDAAAQLAGKPSMMNQGASTKHHDSEGATRYPAVDSLLDWYLKLKDALVNDNFAAASKTAKASTRVLEAVDMKAFAEHDHDQWMKHHAELKDITLRLANARSIDDMRKHFIALSEHMIAVARHFGTPDETLYIQHCPMADGNKGADWLSENTEIRNPYFGSAMLTCGEVTGEISRQ